MTHSEPAGRSSGQALLKMLLPSATSLFIILAIFFCLHSYFNTSNSIVFFFQLSYSPAVLCFLTIYILSFLCWLSLIFIPDLLVSILAEFTSASRYETFHQPQHCLSIHSAAAAAQERPGLPTSVKGIEVNEVPE